MPSKPAPLRKLKAGLDATADYDLWLAPFDKKSQASWAADCAEHVRIHFKSVHPNDDRARKAIAAARRWARGETNVPFRDRTAPISP